MAFKNLSSLTPLYFLLRVYSPKQSNPNPSQNMLQDLFRETKIACFYRWGLIEIIACTGENTQKMYLINTVVPHTLYSLNAINWIRTENKCLPLDYKLWSPINSKCTKYSSLLMLQIHTNIVHLISVFNRFMYWHLWSAC